MGRERGGRHRKNGQVKEDDAGADVVDVGEQIEEAHLVDVVDVSVDVGHRDVADLLRRDHGVLRPVPAFVRLFHSSFSPFSFLLLFVFLPSCLIFRTFDIPFCFVIPFEKILCFYEDCYRRTKQKLNSKRKKWKEMKLYRSCRLR